MRISDWSSDVCSSDLLRARHIGGDVGADLEAADLRQRRCALELEAPDARLVLPEQVKRQFVLDFAGFGFIDEIVEPARIAGQPRRPAVAVELDRSLATPRSEEHTSELHSLLRISSAVFTLKKK